MTLWWPRCEALVIVSETAADMCGRRAIFGAVVGLSDRVLYCAEHAWRRLRDGRLDPLCLIALPGIETSEVEL